MLYLKNALYLEPCALQVRSGTLAVEEGPGGTVRLMPVGAEIVCAPGDTLLDCTGLLVSQSWACGHQHIYSALARGMPPAVPPPVDFLEVLQKLWWRLDKCLDADMIEASALAAAVDMLRHGVTFCIDHHASPHAVAGSLDIIARAFEQVGLEHLLCYEVSCRDGEAIALQGLEEQDQYLAAGNKGHVGLHASFTVSEEILQQAVQLARQHGTGLHIHVAESPLDQEHCQASYGKTVVQRLHDAGALALPQTILAHCVHISPEDARMIAQSPCWVAQNVESNLNNAVGLASYAPFERVMLGTDGMHGDILRSAHAAFLTGRAVENASCATVYQRLRNAHKHGALHGRGNSLNSLNIYAYDSPTPLSTENALGHIFFGLDSSHLRTVISQGRIALHEGQCTLCDSGQIMENARAQAQRLWKKMAG